MSAPYRMLGALFIFLASGTPLINAGMQKSCWYQDYQDARQAALDDDRPILIHFHASWCPPCKKMNAEVLQSEEVRNLLTDKFHAVKVDIDDEPALAKRFNIESVPSDVVVSTSGKVLVRLEGAQTRKNYLAELTRTETQYIASRKKVPARVVTKIDEDEFPSPRTKPSTLAEKKSPPAKEPIKPARTPETQLSRQGIEGYCPVTLWETRRWQKGDSRYSTDYQGLTYYFSSFEERARFVDNPSQYAPKFLGCDPVLLWERDRAVAGKTKYAAYFDGELYLFESTDSRAKFRGNPERYSRVTHSLLLDDIEQR